MRIKAAITAVSITAAVMNAACSRLPNVSRPDGPPQAAAPQTAEVLSPQIKELLASAAEQISTTRSYTQQYYNISYPGGDLPPETGACTDVVIRAFRNAGVDLQKEVHEDITAAFTAYPRKWGLNRPDANIDHRRVPNLQTFFARKGKAVPVTNSPSDYRPGDVVTWDLDGRGMTHIGLVSARKSASSGRYLIIHNIGGGVNAEDRLFEWKITGHYRYF